MNIGGMGSTYDITFTSYQANRNGKDFAGFMKNGDESLTQKTAEEGKKRSVGNFMDDQELNKLWMSQSRANKANFHLGTGVSVDDSIEEDSSDKKDIPEEEETRTEIVVRPDGSKVLMITVTVGGQEAVTSVELAKPTGEDIPSKDISGDVDINKTSDKLIEKVDYDERAYSADSNSAQ